jgi:HAMP domain-containing protein
MTLIEKIRTSFTTQLTLWVACFVLIISGLVLFLLIQFSEGVIHDESIDTTLQALENTALRIDNTLRQTEMTAQQEQRRRVNRSRIERLIEENGYLEPLKESLPNIQLYVTRRDSSQLSIYFAGNESGYRQMVYEGHEIYIFTQPLGERQFILAAVCPAEDIYDKYEGVQWFLLLRAIVGVIILLIILYIVVGRHLRPIHLLADAAQSLSDGRLDTPIPDAHHEHEAGRLQNSLKKMQSSLAAYMTEMRQKQDALSRQNTELQSAYGEAKTYEKLKSKFLHDMTNRMAVPVGQVCHSTDIVCHEYTSLSETEMIRLQTDIMQDTKTITELLEELTKNYVAP